MPIYTEEARIILAIEAIRTARKKPSQRRVAKMYDIPHQTLHDRLHGRPQREKTRVKDRKIDPVDEDTLIQYIIEQDVRGFPLRLSGVEDKANLLLKSRNSVPISKYGIQEEDLYNFDETGFMMEMITAAMVVTRAERHGKAKSVHPGNREWATVIECISAMGWCLPLFVIVQGAYHLASWSEESGFPSSWVIKPTPNGWTDNETGVEWIQHFDKHTKARTKAVYRMLMIDGHESHMSAEFDQYCKDNNIITVSMPPHSSHLLRPLDVALYAPLKRAYGDQINESAHDSIFVEENMQAGFRGAGLVPWNPEAVLSKLDTRIRTPSPSETARALQDNGSRKPQPTRNKPFHSQILLKLGSLPIKEALQPQF